MAQNILVITPQVAFGELIRLTLEETGMYQVRLVPSAASALSSCEIISFNLVILDSSLENQHLPTLEKSLRASVKAVRLVVIPPGDNPRHPLLDGVTPDGYLYQPFYVPEMLESIASLLETSTSNAAAPHANPALPPPWLDTPFIVEQVLQQQLATVTAHTAALVHSRDAWVHYGRLSQSAVKEMTTALARYTGKPLQNDLARFIRLNSDSSEHLFCAMQVENATLLMLVYPPTTSLSKITTELHRFADHIPTLLFEPTEEAVDAPTEAEEETPPRQDPNTAASILKSQAALQQFLAQFPSPEPASEAQNNVRFLFPWEIDPITPAPNTAATQAVPHPQPGSTAPHAIDDTIPIQTTSLEDTQPVRVNPSNAPTRRVSSTSPPANPVYTCVLLPRQTNHTLTGDLAVHLSQWLPELVLSFGWQLEGLVIQRQYLQWSVQVPHSIPAEQVVSAVRQHTSQHIAQKFQRFAPSDTAEDFWSPAVLIINGAESPTPAALAEFLQQNRRQANPQPDSRYN